MSFLDIGDIRKFSQLLINDHQWQLVIQAWFITSNNRLNIRPIELGSS